MEDLVIEYTPEGSRYCRSMSKERVTLQNEILKYYGFDNARFMKALIFPSGMSAISCIINILANGIHEKKTILIGNELYCDTPKVCEYQKNYNPNFSYYSFDVRDKNTIYELFAKHQISLFFIESCTNPSGQIIDYSIIPELKKIAPECLFCVDNTWISAYGINPFEYGFDIVVESLTKYISGGRCIGGTIIGPNNFMEKVLKYIKMNGLFIGSDHCNIYMKGLNTLKTRMTIVSEITIEIAKYLESKKEITRVMYPMLESHPTYALAKKYLKLNPGCILFHIANKKRKPNIKQMIEILSKMEYVLVETSYGGSFSRICPFIKIGHSTKFDQNIDKGIKGAWLRLTIGYNSNKENVIKDLDMIIENLINISQIS